jgi:hypothetical protein
VQRWWTSPRIDLHGLWRSEELRAPY